MIQNSQGYYAQNIVKFLSALREVGIEPSLREAIDAVNALHAVGVCEKGEVRQALCCTLVKDRGHEELFNKAFNAFFVGAEELDELRYLQMIAKNRRKQKMEQSRSELVFQEQPLDIPEELITTYTYMPEEDKERIQDFLERTSTGKNVGPKFKGLTEQLVSGRLRSQRAGGTGAGTGKGDTLLYKSISAISDEEVPRALALIRVLVKQINGKLQRQYKRSTGRGALDIKRSIHKSLSTGGTLFNLSFRRRPRRRQKMVLLYDVSGSMYRFSGFAMQFISGMYKAADKAESYIFSEGCKKLTPKDMQSIESFEKTVTTSALWRRGTDIARALEYLLEPKNFALTPSTVVLIFSDGKTLNGAGTNEALKELNLQTRKVIWMNPLSSEYWGDSKALTAFSKHCLMLDCSTLNNLAHACARSVSMFL